MRSYHRGRAEPVGTLKTVAGANPPPGYLVCDGSTFDGGKYPRLADYLGGTTLPDWRDRALVGAGGAYAPGDGFGADSKSHGHGASTSVSVYNRTLSKAQIPSHGHTIGQRDGNGDPGDNYARNANPANAYSSMGTSAAGGDSGHDHGAGASTSVNAETLDVRQASRAATVCIRT